MKVLFLSPQLPFPLNVGSKIRIFNLLKIYSKQHEVDLVCFGKKNELNIDLSELKKVCCSITIIPDESRLEFEQNKNKFIRWCSFLFSYFPFSVKIFYSKEFVNFLKNVDYQKYDIIHIEKIFLYPNINSVLKLKKRSFHLILDLDDYESIKIGNQLKTLTFSLKKFILFIEYLKWGFLENKIRFLFDYCLITSKIDKEVLEKRLNIKNTFFLPNGVDVDIIKPGNAFENNNQILYFGSMSYYPNCDAVLYFSSKIFPRIKTLMPDTKFIIAGKDPLPEVMKLHNGKDIIVTGTVVDIKPILQDSSLVVVPLRFGGGTRIKILEAMAMKKAIVSTSIGCEGIELQAENDIVIADNPEEFSDACIEILQNKQYRKFIGENARKTVETKYCWNMIGESFLCFLQKIKSNMYYCK